MKKLAIAFLFSITLIFNNVISVSAEEFESATNSTETTIEYFSETSYEITTIEESNEIPLVYNSKSNATSSGGSSPVSKKIIKIYKTDIQGSASVNYGYSYELYKYKNGTKYYYQIKNPKYLRCIGGQGVVCKGYFNFEIRNTTYSGGRSYMYATPVLTGYKNMLTTNKVLAPYNT